VNQTPIVSTIDVTGGGLAIDLPQNLLNFTRSRNFQIHNVGSCRRMQDYRGWLVEVLDHPYLNTIDALGTGRETYAEEKAPSIQMASGFTKINIGASVVMILHVKSYY